MKIKHTSDYRSRRAAEYPILSDQLDALVKGLNELRAGRALPKETLDWVDQCLAVKKKYPKK